MSDPQSTNLGLYLPVRGSDPGTWDLPINADNYAVDSLFANVATISLTNANVTLTEPPNSGAAWSGPYQSQSGIIKLTGTLTGNCTITIPRAGFFIIDNQCTVGSFYVRLGSSAPGKYIGVPPGAATHVYCDGTDVRFVDMPAVGSLMFLCGVTAAPAWIAACTTLPWLACDGTIKNFSDFPFLGPILGSKFGGNGSTTFAVPPLENTVPLMWGALITVPGSGIDGASIGAQGGSQSVTLTAPQMPQQTTGVESAPHTHNSDIPVGASGGGAVAGAGNFQQSTFRVVSGTESVQHTHLVGNASPTPVVTLPPLLVAGTYFIKT